MSYDIIERLGDFWPDHPAERKLIADSMREIERLRAVLRRVVVSPSGDRTARVSFVSEDCMVSFPIRPQTTRALEVLIEFDQARREALEGKP